MNLVDLHRGKIMDNLHVLSIFLGCFVVLLSLYWWYKQRKYKLPPAGPWGLPFVGYLPFLGQQPFKTLIHFTKKFGNIYSLNLGGSYTVVLNDFESVKEAFNNPAIQDRPPNLFDFHPDGLGLAGNNGLEWIEQRRYAMKTLKDAGMAKVPWESNLQAEVEDFLAILEDQDGKPYDVTDALLNSVSNNMTTIILEKRLLKGDPRRTIVDNGVKAVIVTFSTLDPAFLFPSIAKFIAKLGFTSYSKNFKKMLAFNRLIRSEIKSRQKISTSEQNESNFIDGYLQEMERMKGKEVQNYFNEKNLIGVAQTLVIGGSEGPRTLLTWLFLAMATNPEIQKKVQKEIDTVLGKDGKIRWSERSKLPYTYAATLEANRWRTVSPLGVLHRVREDTTVGGYDVPKGSNVMSNIYALHNDPRYWKDPGTFNPDRFLLKDGTVALGRVDSYMPFSFGRRICPGEMIAMMEIFQYFLSIMQRFDILPLENNPPNLEGINGGTFHAVEQKLRYVPRN
ncbi:cytochrome P450 2J6 [Caerostris extrusa]|uniref:Cytochrome P450 2J6 n=1 Tax=Caerostris extrusa TaxID=172846 RepID=A0AAV4MA66_CAEEX|nr:cytochrome P450 2J6 [Caerostris extrusa]